MSRILIAGGGTAGHVVPALALADVLTDRGHEVSFCGSGKGMEGRLVPEAGYSFSVVRIRGFTRRLGVSTLRTLGSIPVAGMDAWRLLSRVRPECVVGVGAYASGPVVAEAAMRGLATVAVEMDSHMGWTNRILSRLVDRVCLSYPDSTKSASKYVYTGRPLRPSLLQVSRDEGVTRFSLDPNLPVLLIFGGSLGSRALNEAAVGAFAAAQTEFQILHVAGEREYESVATAVKQGANARYQAFSYLDDFPLALAAADAVVSRAGGSVAEILARGVPALLVPYPLAAGDHQSKNAHMIARGGAARVVTDAELTPRVLTQEVDMLLDPATNAAMKQAALKLARPDAAGRIADVIVELLSPSKV
jgi:UDP-N-acetylglucosamine--N-acetylmuramyl-(pentapeptide) pyrophosphoryl-undecaprenol N-acetylglucosamine transferase